MGTALFTGVTGLKVQQTKLDAIASNIANVNTTGYRSSRVLFQDLFSQTLQGGTAAVGDFGGTNPQQVGLGARVASIDVIHEQGSLITTGLSSDLAIQGNGFFTLTNGSKMVYTRDGSFQVNANGKLIEPATGFRVQGFLADETGTIAPNAVPEDIEIPVGSAGISRATTVATLIGNLNPTEDPDATPPKVVTRTIQVFDSLGTQRNIDLTYTKSTTDSNVWNLQASFEGTLLLDQDIEFDSSGAILDADALQTITVAGNVLADTAAGEALPDDLSFTLDLSEVTQLADGDSFESDVALRNQDGFTRGVLETFNISANGEIVGVFSNGLTRVVAQIALATFSNVGGLSRDGNNAFVETTSSGSAQIGTPQTGGRGIVTGGVLESSNVDLGSEFSELIITQRGFQANARTITAADTLLQETVNLIR
jgi:flagellar hook protein FlgE